MSKKQLDPTKTKAYNHYPIDGEKPVISNLMFKETYDSNDINHINEVIQMYALDETQKNLLTNKLNTLNEATNQTDLPPLSKMGGLSKRDV